MWLFSSLIQRATQFFGQSQGRFDFKVLEERTGNFIISSKLTQKQRVELMAKKTHSHAETDREDRNYLSR